MAQWGIQLIQPGQFFPNPLPLPPPLPAPVVQIIGENHIVGNWHNTTRRERQLIEWLRIHLPIIQQMFRGDAYGNPINPPSTYQFKEVRDGDSVRQTYLKVTYNSLLFSLKTIYNDSLYVADARIRFTLLANINTGGRPTGAPWNHRMVIEFTLRQWYQLGEEIGLFTHWRQLALPLGTCRLQWCDFHRVAFILTSVERSDPTLPPVGGWFGYPVPASPWPPRHLGRN
ncbi:hypothetical protein BJ508DRAFT_313953 [Ascobolus immersus RN42]|uniref:Uncharacterized protein n=1 Tax=Ascobolus immersus RN42 TaxID=1160509 RepID=A0A3N4HGU6_ASCIM|nr:hypothetical protein BJ508DRAFT_313953 [Ascobolus immersus RN42]